MSWQRRMSLNRSALPIFQRPNEILEIIIIIIIIIIIAIVIIISIGILLLSLR